MQALPSPPPPSLQHQLQPLPEKETTTAISLNQIIVSKQAGRHQQSSPREVLPYSETKLVPFAQTRLLAPKQPILQPRRTNPLIWFGAILCLIFSLLLIFFGIATLILYLVVKPKHPVFDVPNASLNGIYFDSPEFFNGDLTFLANFSNPNHKLDVRFEHVDIEVYFSNRLIGTQALQPFTQRPREIRLQAVRVISSLVYLPQNSAVELQKQVLSNKVNYNIRATFKLKAILGLFHYNYWLHGRCEMAISGPPTGVLVARSCNTNR
ncbi:unnamed protein product [Linum tenue]|uniref:Late embryogenesis abundant protein LEA-2 subgroup domain-containing protein n=1 Tax=Linum tenue TaxID=586396 RepID=A0AAV0MVC8_9ROSI|nr:unnamed protein product [Linum tenue]